jgi:hypothetical protein
MKILLLLLCLTATLSAKYPEKTPDTAANRAVDTYLAARTAEIEQSGSLRSITRAEQWKQEAPKARAELFEMLGLSPLPPRTQLKPVITGTELVGAVRIEKLHFQSMPQLYVTGNFYLPKDAPAKPLPTILYVCGHSVMKKDGVSYGNKAGYHHHGMWFAQQGYACLIIDTLQLGEIEGEHHGTHRLDKWWWISRGYTPAGVEAWNSIRALDYLETRPEVDSQRIGVTGRSGGGAYSWWIAALDDRIKVAAPTAGVTSMHNHVVDGVIEGHCDCMFQLNTYRWDYDRLVALVAPRPLLICNTDKDPIFPIDGVFQLYQSARRIYGLLGADAALGLQVAEGPHKDVQPLNTGAFHWMERHLKGADPMATTDLAAKKCLEPEQLRVFKGLPADQRNTRIDQEFVPMAKATVPESREAWERMTKAWREALVTKVFRAWPTTDAAAELKLQTSAEADGVTLKHYVLSSQSAFSLDMYVAHRAGLKPEEIELIALHVEDAQSWQQWLQTYGKAFPKLLPTPPAEQDAEAWKSEQDMMRSFKWAMVHFTPRGIGNGEWTGSKAAQTHQLRRLALLGETMESGQVYDIRRAVQALRGQPGWQQTKLWLTASRQQAVNALYASLFESNINRVDLHELPTSHMSGGPAYLNVLRYLDIPQATAMAAQLHKLVLFTEDKAPWSFLTETAQRLGLEKNLQLRSGQQL